MSNEIPEDQNDVIVEPVEVAAPAEVVEDTPSIEQAVEEDIAVEHPPSPVVHDATPVAPEQSDLDEIDDSHVPSEEFGLSVVGSPNVHAESAYSEPRRANMRVPVEDSLHVPPVRADDLVVHLDRMPEQIAETLLPTKENNSWLANANRAMQHSMMSGVYNAAADRETAEWVERPEHEGQRLGMARPRFSDDSDGGRLVGARAIARMQQVTNMGLLLRIPLWHAGIWVTLKAPTDIELLELDRRVQTEKVQLGMSTSGLAFSNTAVTISELLVNWILSRIYTTTAPVDADDVQGLLKLIPIEDLPQLVWGALSTMYPAGYPYVRPCVCNPIKCKHVVEETLLLTKLSWVDRNRLTPGQLRHMGQRTGQRTLKELETYRSAHTRNDNTIELNENLTVVLRSPMLSEYFEWGNAWINELSISADAVLAVDASPQERNNEIFRRASVSMANQYIHYIERISVRNEKSDADNFIEGADDIRGVLNVVSGQTDLMAALADGIVKYINSATVSMIAIPRFNCPSCQTDQNLLFNPDGTPMRDSNGEQLTVSKHPQLIPLEMLGVFFTISAPRVTRIMRSVLGRSQ